MQKGEQTRQRIIEASAPLFNQRGFEGCSMGDIMEATGLEKGGIYRYFDTKEALAVEALKYAIARARKSHTADLDHIASPLAKLHHVVHRFVSEPSPLPGGCPFINTAVDSDDGNAALRALARRAFADWRSRLETIAQAAIDAGEIRSEVKPEQLADTIIAALEGALVMSRIARDAVPLQSAQAMLDMLLTSMSLGPASKPRKRTPATR